MCMYVCTNTQPNKLTHPMVHTRTLITVVACYVCCTAPRFFIYIFLDRSFHVRICDSTSFLPMLHGIW